MVKLIDVARRAGVGYGTASRALSGKGSVDGATRDRVIAAAAELGFRPNAAARALRERRTRTVGLLVPDIVNEFYTSSAAVLQTELDDAGYQLLVAATANDRDRERRALSALLDRGIDALVHVPVNPRLDLPDELPVIELNRHSARRRPAVLADDVRGVGDLARELLELGYRDLAIIGGPATFSTSRDRLSGFRRATEGMGVRTRELEAPFTVAAGDLAFRELLDDPPQVVVALGARLAMGVLRAASDTGVRIPDDVALAGYGDPEWFPLWRPGITTFVPPLAAMGESTARLVIEALEERRSAPNRRVRLPGRVVVRGSTPPR